MEKEKIAGMPEEVSEVPVVTEKAAVVSDEKLKAKRTTAPQFTEEEMYQIIRDFKASGQTRREFCKVRNYPMSNFYYWQKKFNQKFPEEMTEKSERGTKGKKEATDKSGTRKKKVSGIRSKKEKAVETKGKGRVKKSTAVDVVAEVTPIEGVSVTPEPPAKRRGRPKKVETAIPAAVAEKRPKGTKATKTVKADKVAKTAFETTAPITEKAEKAVKKSVTKATEVQPTALFQGVYMQIRYPNGIRINVPADIDMKRLKELFQL
jgi:hypothetical protein